MRVRSVVARLTIPPDPVSLHRPSRLSPHLCPRHLRQMRRACSGTSHLRIGDDKEKRRHHLTRSREYVKKAISVGGPL